MMTNEYFKDPHSSVSYILGSNHLGPWAPRRKLVQNRCFIILFKAFSYKDSGK